MKRLVTMLLICTLILVGCGGTESGESTKLTESELHEKLEEVYTQICTAYEYADELATRIHTGWDDHNSFMDHAFDSDFYYSKRSYFNADYQNEVETVFKLMDTVGGEVSKAKEMLKEYSEYSEDSYYQALKEMYLAVESYSEFAINFPEGYSLMTHSSKIVETRSEFSDLKNKAEFEK